MDSKDFLKHIKILSDNEIADIKEIIRFKVMEKYKLNPKIYDTNPDFVQETFRDYYSNEKILVTNGITVWNPYKNPVRLWNQKPVKFFEIRKSPFLYLQYRFILDFQDRKERRNALIRLKRVKNRKQIKRVCAYCGKDIPPEYNITKKYCNISHQMKAYRHRKK